MLYKNKLVSVKKSKFFATILDSERGSIVFTLIFFFSVNIFRIEGVVQTHNIEAQKIWKVDGDSVLSEAFFF